MKVRATNMYTEKHIEDAQLKRIPKEGEEWEVTEARYQQLCNNVYGVKFVDKVDEVETAVKNPVVEKAVKKTTKKK